MKFEQGRATLKGVDGKISEEIDDCSVTVSFTRYP